MRKERRDGEWELNKVNKSRKKGRTKRRTRKQDKGVYAAGERIKGK